MIAQILIRTPVYVWVLLAFFIYRGLMMRRDRELPLANLFILPVVFIALAWQGMAQHYGAVPAPWVSWLIAAALGALIGFRTVSPRMVGAGARGVTIKGSWAPLALALGIFLVKYVTEVAIAVRPDAMLTPGAIVAVCALYGIMTGVFIGRLVRTATLYRLARQAQPRVLADKDADPRSTPQALG